MTSLLHGARAMLAAALAGLSRLRTMRFARAQRVRGRWPPRVPRLAVAVAVLAAQMATGTHSAVRAQEDNSAEVPEPQSLTLNARDGLQLRVRYYPSLAGKEAVPVVMLHRYEGSSSDYDELARLLQAEHGCAVVVPDLRGHGESRQFVTGGRELRADRLRVDDYRRMVEDDMEAIKSFLIERNNAGELNIEKLCVVGAELGTLVALNWARLDWSWPVLPVGKQGQDVKALVLISPEVSLKGLRAQDALSDESVRSKLSVHIVVGRHDAKSRKNAQLIHNRLKPHHPDPPADRVREEKDLFYDDTYETSLQGTAMLGANLGVEARIARFIELRLIERDFPWQQRKSPI